jgi:hypothetical protein
MSGVELNSTTNDLLLKYNEKFDENYNKIIKLNTSITNKEELIVLINDIIYKKDNYITILKYGMLLIVLLGILFILYNNNYITLVKFIIIFVVILIVYLVIIYYITMYNFKNTLKNIGVKIKDNALIELANVNIKPYTCPTKCTTNPNPSPNFPSSNLTGIATPTLNIDPQNNVWKYGDIPSGGYSNRRGSEINNFYTSPSGIPNYPSEENEPQPDLAFGTTYPFTTYYKCEWLGPNGNPGLPVNENSTQYTTIPCHYRPNYQETGRYICENDPNNSDINSCDDVSIIS